VFPPFSNYWPPGSGRGRLLIAARVFDHLSHADLTVLVISYGALARRVFKFSDVWVTEVTTYLIGYMTFVGTATVA
jgi:hypothetical protein